MVKAAIFDWGGVLIEDPAPKVLDYFSTFLGVTAQAFNEAYLPFLADFQKGFVSEDVLWELVCSKLKVEEPKVNSLWTEAFRSAYRPRAEMFALLSELRQGGSKVALLSNTEIPAMKFFQDQGYDLFDVTVFSCAEGTWKPERRIYEIALERLKVHAREAVFVDDRRDFIAAAQEIGLNAILFLSPGQVRADLVPFSRASR